jgi:His-Xaa-Ser system radical SAM maturase HxsC
MFGIPLYSDIAARHDFVVQAAGAYDQTIRGIVNLLRCGARVEIRVVLHAETIERLPALARFIVRNLPNVHHVALMGLEMMGYVKMNLTALWIDPADYQRELSCAVRELDRARIPTSIYNHQLCVLDRGLWPFARQSISDWKNEYLEICDYCSVRDRCGGFFSSASLKRSAHIHAISDDGGMTACVRETRPEN